jgi:membrane-associated phospholipid phosphatase
LKIVTKLYSKKNIYKIIGIIGTIAWLIVYIKNPYWPTPDRLLVLLIFVFMIFARGWQLFKRLAPFIALLLVYESFRGLADSLNTHVNYGFMPAADKLLFFGHLPTAWLQQHFWNGTVQWYDFFFYIFYMLHFVLPIALALVIWKLRDKYYWRYITSYVLLSFSGFITYALFPAAPPWMASAKGVIEPISRISSSVWYSLGIKDFPSVYNKISPNAVAAMPSLHAAYSTLFAIFVFRLFGRKWGALSLVYPMAIYIGTVFQGEHYAIDIIAGAIFAFGAYFVTPPLLRSMSRLNKQLIKPKIITPIKQTASRLIQQKS